MAQYRIGQAILSPEQPDFDQMLGSAYNSRLRPICQCVGDPGVPMYIVQINGRFWLKRMPNTGRQHAIGCASWEMPEEFSGRSDLYGSGLTYDEDKVKLRLSFPLSRRGSQAPPAVAKSSTDKPSVQADIKRLTLRGLLHYLWDEAGLTKWPGKSTKRNWAFVNESLTIAADGKTVKQGDLQHYLYLPEPWIKEHREEIAGRRRERFAATSGSDGKNAHQLLLLIAEVKEIKQAGIGFSTVLFHLPDCSFIMDQKLHERLLRHFGREVRMWTGKSPGHIMIAATFSVSPEGSPQFEEVSLMFVSEEWIPYENVYELALIQKLVADKRSFLRLLRYNRPSDAPMPAFLLTDHGNEPVALYVIDAEFSLDDRQVEAAASASKYEYWVWSSRTHAGAVPTLPAPLPPTGTSAATASHRDPLSTQSSISNMPTLSGGSVPPVNQPSAAAANPAETGAHMSLDAGDPLEVGGR